MDPGLFISGEPRPEDQLLGSPLIPYSRCVRRIPDIQQQCFLVAPEPWTTAWVRASFSLPLQREIGCLFQRDILIGWKLVDSLQGANSSNLWPVSCRLFGSTLSNTWLAGEGACFLVQQWLQLNCN